MERLGVVVMMMSMDIKRLITHTDSFELILEGQGIFIQVNK